MDGSGKTPAGLSDTRTIGRGFALQGLEPAAAFQWAVLAEEAMSQGYSERAEELIELAYSANDF